MADIRVRAYFDPGNIGPFASAINSGINSIRNALRSSTAAPIASQNVPGLNVSRLTSSLSVADRSLINSGQVYHRVVTGWISDMKRLDAAANTPVKGYGGITFKGPGGVPSVYGSGVAPVGRTGAMRAGVFPAYQRAQEENFMEGKLPPTYRNMPRIQAALTALQPAFTALDDIEKKAQLWTDKSTAYRSTATEAKAQLVQSQTALLNAMRKLESVGGGIPTTFGPAGAIPGTLLPKPSEARAISQSATMGAWLANPQQAAIFGPISQLPTQEAQDKATEKWVRNQIRTGNLAGAPLTAALEETRGTVVNGQWRSLAQIRAEAVATGAEIDKIGKHLEVLDRTDARVERSVVARKATIGRQYAAQDAELQASLMAPALPEQLDRLLATYGPFRRQFIQKMGFKSQYGTQAFADEFEARKMTAEVSKDFQRGTYTVRGTAEDRFGVQGSWGTVIDEKTGKSMERFNGMYRSTNSFLKNMVVDFKKVVEWTVATTAVFGILGVTLANFTKINDINMDLQRFQITAKTTGEETKAAFSDIAQVAYDTATPLKEMTAVMDDIALATRRVNQTQAEWAQGQKDLARAVGIFTNLTGTDTARATDMLSSAFKQLNIPTSQLEMVLNKVTAVAGGNAQAIQDITQALGGLATAAGAAGMSLDEQIASVQTLSQVTNKTSADVATAFKNLFGAINAPASEKMLKSFGIEIRDVAGNLRPFLDIYKDIYKARAQGVIPEGRVQDVLRAISGGPRRAPDAAALLENLPKIYEVLGTSINATNEALIANAKILDTNKAKMEQMRTAFDTALVEKFTDAVNKLTEVLTTIGKALTGAFGGLPSELMSVIVQMGLMVTAGLLLRKVFMLLKNELGVVRNDLSNIFGLSSGAPMGAGLSQRFAAQAQAAQGARAANIRASNRSNFRLFTPVGITPGLPGPANAQWVNGSLMQPAGNLLAHPMWQPTTRPATPFASPVPGGGIHAARVRGATGRFLPGTISNLPTLSNARPLPIQTLSVSQLTLAGNAGRDLGNSVKSGIFSGLSKITGSGRLGIAAGLTAGAGAAMAGGALAGNNTNALNTISSLGMAISPFLMMAGPMGAAAGVGLFAASAGLQVISSEALKAEENLNKARISVHDLTQSFLSQTTEVDNAKAAQLDLQNQIDRFGFKAVKTSEDLARIAQLQDQYAEATLRVIDAQSSLADVQSRLIEQLPQLGDRYKEILQLGQKGYLTGKEGQQISTTLAQDILAQSGQLGAPNIDIAKFFSGLTQQATLGTTQYGGAAPGPAPDVTARVIKEALAGNWREFYGALKGESRTGPMPWDAAGFVRITGDFLRAGQLAWAAASEEDKKTKEFGDFVQLFGTIIAQYGDSTSRISAAVSTYQAQTQAAGAIGGLTGEDLKNAQARGTLADSLLKARQANMLYGGGRGRSSVGGNEAAIDPQIQKLLMGTGKIGRTDALSAFKTVAERYGQYENLVKNGTFERAAVDWLQKQGIEVAGLTDKVKGLQEAEEERIATLEEQLALQESMRGGYESTAMSLGQELANLQAQKLGGEFKGREGDYTAQVSQIRALIAANTELNGVLDTQSKDSLEALGNQLGKVTGLFGVQFQSVEQLTGSIINWGRQMGLTPKQIREAIDAVLALNKQLAILQALQEVTVKINVVITKQTETLKGESDMVKNRGTDPTVARMRANQAAIAKVNAEIDRLIAKISGIGGSGSGTSYGTTSSGGGGGGGGSTGDRGSIDLPDEWKTINYKSMVNQAVAWAKKYQKAIPGEAAKNRNDLVAVMLGNTRVLLQRGIGEEYLRKAIDKLTEQIKKQNELLTKADTISRIRIGAGDFASIANVPMNSKTGISVGGPGQPININLNINGQVMTPAQLQQLANALAAQIKKSYQNT